MLSVASPFDFFVQGSDRYEFRSTSDYSCQCFGLYQVHFSHAGHKTKMATTSVYGKKKPSKIFFSGTSGFQ